MVVLGVRIIYNIFLSLSLTNVNSFHEIVESGRETQLQVCKDLNILT